MFNECCINKDCPVHNRCVSRSCIDEGYPRFTLSWVGDDDYDLFVVTPSGFTLSFDNDLDEETGGRVGEPTTQNSDGYHVENVFFPLNGSAPVGTYEFFVRPISTVGVEDTWTLHAYDESGEVFFATGTKFSPTYEYVRSSSEPSDPLIDQPSSFPTAGCRKAKRCRPGCS